MILSRLGLGLLLAWCGLSLAAAFEGRLVPIWRFGGMALGAAAILDLVGVLLRKPLQVERVMPATLSLGVAVKLGLKIHNPSKVGRRVWMHDLLPVQFHTKDLPRKLRVPKGGWAEMRYECRPTSRGTFDVPGVEYRAGSPLGLWWRRRSLDVPHQFRVYPNFNAVARYAMMATDNRLSELGIRKRQRRGQGTEFHQLREYQTGDALRQIDWRATSRLLKLISREYRDERNQQVIFLLDCGRRMHAKDDDLTHLDHSLNAMLLLAYVALHQGDAVGLSTFGGIERTLAPRKGTGYLNALLNATFDVETTTQASDFYGAMTGLLKRIRKRSLVVVVSNLRDEEDPELTRAVHLARRKHLVLVASLREQILGKMLASTPHDFDTALQYAAAHRYVDERSRAHKRLRDAGVLYMDVEPQGLAVNLVNRYLEVKASGAL